MISKTVRLNSHEMSVIYCAVSSELRLYEEWLKKLMDMNPDNLSPDKRAERDMLITSHQARIDTMKKVMEKV